MDFEADMKIIAIGAHPDDIEFGCGGLLMKLKAKNAELWYVAMTRCNDQFSVDEQDMLLSEQKVVKTILEFCEALYSVEGMSDEFLESFKRKTKEKHGHLKNTITKPRKEKKR